MSNIKLQPKQIEYLKQLEEKPLTRMHEEPRWLQKLWHAEFIDIIGNSVYITDAGRDALTEVKRRD